MGAVKSGCITLFKDYYYHKMPPTNASTMRYFNTKNINTLKWHLDTFTKAVTMHYFDFKTINTITCPLPRQHQDLLHQKCYHWWSNMDYSNTYIIHTIKWHLFNCQHHIISETVAINHQFLYLAHFHSGSKSRINSGRIQHFGAKHFPYPVEFRHQEINWGLTIC